ncbi:MAG: GTPase HflX [Planctomycetes bacterium]|nr:GTPase HflX [Planctomycetota bacterium]
MSRSPKPTDAPRERVLVCGVMLEGQRAELGGPLAEAQDLIRAAGAEVVGEPMTQKRLRPHPATLMGRGKVDEIGLAARSAGADAVLVDNSLSPAQLRNLEKAWDLRVLDRSELILDIFARRARTRQASLQVELAQNEYLMPRLRRMWTHLERTEGAIGTRGPGETQLETDRRLLRKRLHDLRSQLKQIEARRLRQVESRRDQFQVGLVGYTNAGKSTLLNALTGSGEFVADMPFATLDTRTRQWNLPDGRMVLLSDTVGFLQRLPHHLVASFHATLEESIHADLLLHVIDASHPDVQGQMLAVEETLAEIAPGRAPQVLVFNKVDRLDDPIGLHLLEPERDQDVIYLSAATGEGLERLAQRVAEELDRRSSRVDVFLALSCLRLSGTVRELAALEEEEWCADGSLRLRVRITDEALGNLRHQAGRDSGLRIAAVSSASG